MKQYRSISLLIVAGLLCPNLLWATIPDNYYSSVNYKSTPTEILNTLHNVISKDRTCPNCNTHNVIAYGSLENCYPLTDSRPDGKVWDMYSTCTFTFSQANCNQNNVCDCWNKEHSIPQSWFGKATPMKSDLFHVIPTDARVNNFRGNDPMGETSSTAYIDNSSYALGHLGTSNFPGYSGKVYEPADEYKGDFARIYFYMCARYRDKSLNSSPGSAIFTPQPTDLTSYAVALFMKWHRQDPVSQKEIDRNNAIDINYQHNRNPFVDYPYLAEYIWGTKIGTQVNLATDFISSDDERFIPDVSDGSVSSTDPYLHSTSTQVVFAPVMETETAVSTIALTGANLTEGIDIVISGENADYFSAEPDYIDAENANGTTVITLTYTPAAIGLHSATLTISSEGADDLELPLNGACASQCLLAWKVDGQDWNYGDPTTAVALGGAPTVIPTAPSSCSDESEQFVGWSAFLISGTTDEIPADLFSDAEDAPEIMENTTFHAVFAHLDVQESVVAPTTETFTFSEMGYANGKEMKGVVIPGDAVSLVFDKPTSGGNPPKYYNSNGNAVRCYPENTLTVTAEHMTEIEFIFDSTDPGSNPISCNQPTFTSPKWTGEADEVVFTFGGSSGHRRIAGVKVTMNGSTTVINYNRYMTTCTAGEPTDMQPTHILHSTPVHKFLQGEYLLIEVNDRLYNAQGQRLK